MEKPELLNFHEACKYMRIGSARMYALLDAGIVKRINYSSNRKPFLKKDLDDAMRKLQTGEGNRKRETKPYAARVAQ